jgi:hypothetical protein
VADDAPVDDDALVSVEELALRWKTRTHVVARLVADQVIPSLDGGLLARGGRSDVPVLRPSWGEAMREDSPGAARRIDTAPGLHPAASAANDLHYALSKRDADAVWALSSSASRSAAGDPGRLVGLWLDALGEVFSARTGIATGVYALVPHRGVGVRLVGGVGPLPVVYDRPTPLDGRGMFVFVPEDVGWRADLPLTAADVDYPELVRSAPPAGWSRADDPLP